MQQPGYQVHVTVCFLLGTSSACSACPAPRMLPCQLRRQDHNAPSKEDRTPCDVEQSIRGVSSSELIYKRCYLSHYVARLRKMWVPGKKSTKAISRFNRKLILNSTILLLLTSYIYLKEVFAKYSIKILYIKKISN